MQEPVVEFALHNMEFSFDHEAGMLQLMGIPSAMFWLDPSLLHMLQPLAKELGKEMFQMQVAWSSSKGTKEDYNAMVTAFSDNFYDGFLAWGKAVGSVGWGRFEVPHYDFENKRATVTVHDTWELLMQRNISATWGCPFIQGKLIGIFSHAFGCNCWADQLAIQYNPNEEDGTGRFVTFTIAPSTRTIEAEIAHLREARMVERERELTALVDAQTLKLRIATQEAESANRAKSAFLATMSHELRTPLNAIIGYAELITEDLEDEASTISPADLSKIESAGKHLLGLIDRVLDLSKIEAGQEILSHQTLEYQVFFGNIKDIASSLASKNNNDFALHLPKKPTPVVTDVLKLRQILLNLISNACKFTQRGKIQMSVETSDLELLVKVEDNGIGIPDEKKEAIFEAFTQAHNDRIRNYEGTGLGLSLSRRLAHLLGGTLQVESVDGEGSTFILKLPVTPPSPLE